MVNTYATRAQRVEPRNALDDFPTQPWATRALCEKLCARHYRLAAQSVWEPACNRGYMARPLAESFGRMIATDVFDYGWSGQEAVQDFLLDWPCPDHPERRVDWVITNPPFNAAEAFLNRALSLADVGVALLLRSQWLHGVGRWRAVFSRYPVVVMPFVERLPLVRGRVDPAVSTATDYSWFVWLRDMPVCGIDWIEPCRKRLEMAGDYAAPEPAEAGGLLKIMEA